MNRIKACYNKIYNRMTLYTISSYPELILYKLNSMPNSLLISLSDIEIKFINQSEYDILKGAQLSLSKSPFILKLSIINLVPRNYTSDTTFHLLHYDGENMIILECITNTPINLYLGYHSKYLMYRLLSNELDEPKKIQFDLDYN
jgi:hypothetical protein